MPTPVLISDSDLNIIDSAIKEEFYASNMYKNMANQMQRAGFFGAECFYKKSSEEELEHYQKLANFLNDLGSFASIPAVPAFQKEYRDLGSTLQDAYDFEKQLGDKYKGWWMQTNDPYLKQFLLQYLEEQRSAVGEFGDLISRYDQCKANPAAILEFDSFMGSK